MKKIILFISCLFVFVFANAQAPVFEWAKQMGGPSDDASFSIAVDIYGNVYTTGSFSGTVDFDPGAGIFNLTSYAVTDIYILKLDVVGNFVWAKRMGGASVDDGISIGLDASGNVYTTGWFNGIVDFDPGVGIFNVSSLGSEDVFISKLDSSGNFLWAQRMGGSGDDYVYSIFIDGIGNVYTTGFFNGVGDFDPGVGTFNLTPYGIFDTFISKLDSAGNFVWAKNVGSSLAFVTGNSITVDEFGNVYTTGYFQGTTDFNPGSGIFNLTPVGNSDIFILKLDIGGNFVWAKKIGGTTNDYGNSIVVDNASGCVYTLGNFQGTVDFDPNGGVFNLTSPSSSFDLFISKLDSLGNFVWAKSIGGVGGSSVAARSIALGAFGNIYTTGWFDATADFDPNSGVANLTSIGGQDIFVSKLDVSGNFVWAERLGGISDDLGYAISIDTYDNVYTTGRFQSTADFDSGVGAFNLISAGSNDDFIHKMSQIITGINETINLQNISIYPNPNNGTFNISLSSQIKNASIEVYNYLGALVFKQEIINQENSIELSNQSNGLYFVKVMSENKIVGTGKMVKQ